MEPHLSRASDLQLATLHLGTDAERLPDDDVVFHPTGCRQTPIVHRSIDRARFGLT